MKERSTDISREANITMQEMLEMFNRVSDRMIDRINDQEREISSLRSRVSELEKQKHPLRRLMIA